MPSSRARIDQAGRLLIPAEIRRQLGLSPGDPVVLEVSDDRLEVRPYRRAIEEAQAIIRKYIEDPDRSLVDELIDARRRSQAAEYHR